ncbi:LA_2272 family surface repeat-containing protein [Victivallis vadensis]|uniref:Secreted protein n=1 Tax=Victivallis vadensis TaxID=172901 RepID=A0A2U1B8D1_9BACT|nr:hypothetical protein [Victivallis vadensis]PVY44908.1 hypothetical protein C8D82_10452 [Victivallis vadensis]
MMRKKLLTGMALAVFAAIGAVGAEPVPNDDWSFITLAFTPTQPAAAATTTVCGVKVGLPMSGGPAPVYGVEASVFNAGTDKVVGIQTSLISTVSEETTGLQFSLVNFSVKVAGVQLGIVNVADDESLQIGLLNFIKNSPVFCLPIVNVRL